MGTIYISIIMLCRVAQHLCNKGTSNCVTNKEVFLKYSAYRQIFSAILGVLLIVVAGNGFPVQNYTVHILEPIYPDESLDMNARIKDMMQKNYQAWVEVYEKFYGEKLVYLTKQAETEGVAQ